MALIWLTSLFLAIASISGGMLYRHDILYGLNQQAAQVAAISDNMLSFSNASNQYLFDLGINSVTQLNNNEIVAYLPSSFKLLLDYSVVSGLDATNSKWLIISFKPQSSNGLKLDGRDVLANLAQQFKSQYVDYQSVGENNDCQLSTTITPVSVATANAFASICNSLPNAVAQYVFITKVAG